jgi:magnesium transporter
VSVRLALARAFAEAHPDQIARAADAWAPAELAPLLEAVNVTVAAKVLESCTPRVAAAAFRSIAVEKRSGIGDALGPQRMSTLLLALVDTEREELLKSLPASQRRAIEGLIRHGPHVAGGIAEPRVASVHENATVADALLALKNDARGALYYVYVVGPRQTLTGVASLRQLLVANESAHIATVMTRNPVAIVASTPLASVAKNPGWLRFPTLPVVSAERELLGVIRYARYQELIGGLDESQLEAERHASTVSALAEVYSVGTTALVHWVGSALTREGADGE